MTPAEIAASVMEDVPDIGRGSIVVVNLHSPREKIWGMVVQLNGLGVTLRGIDLASFEDLVNEVARPSDAPTMGLTTLFVPMHRLERISLDVTEGAAQSCAEFYEQRTKMPVLELFRRRA